MYQSDGVTLLIIHKILISFRFLTFDKAISLPWKDCDLDRSGFERSQRSHMRANKYMVAIGCSCSIRFSLFQNFPLLKTIDLKLRSCFEINNNHFRLYSLSRELRLIFDFRFFSNYLTKCCFYSDRISLWSSSNLTTKSGRKKMK